MDKRILHFTAQTFRPVPSHLLHPPSLLYYSSTPRPLHFLDNTVERDAMVELRSEISSIIRQIAQEYIQQYPVPSTSFTVQTSTSTSTSGKKVNTSGMYVTIQFILYFIFPFFYFILFLSFYLSFYLIFTYFFLHINIITSLFIYLFIYLFIS